MRKCMKYINPCHIKYVSSATSGKKTLHTQLELLLIPILFFFPHRFYHHPNIIPYQHSQTPCWHQLGSAKGNYPNYQQITNPMLFIFMPLPSDSPNSHHQWSINFKYSEIPPSAYPPAALRWLPSIIYPRKPKYFLSIINFPYYVLKISPKPSNLATVPNKWSPHP